MDINIFASKGLRPHLVGGKMMRYFLILGILSLTLLSCSQEKGDWTLEDVKVQEFFTTSVIRGTELQINERTVLFNSKTGEVYLLSAVSKEKGDEELSLIPSKK